MFEAPFCAGISARSLHHSILPVFSKSARASSGLSKKARKQPW
jgi:hypothetical protein